MVHRLYHSNDTAGSNSLPTGNNHVYEWQTTNGNITSDPFASVIGVDEAGLYQVTVQPMNWVCSLAISLMVMPSSMNRYLIFGWWWNFMRWTFRNPGGRDNERLMNLYGPYPMAAWRPEKWKLPPPQRKDGTMEPKTAMVVRDWLFLLCSYLNTQFVYMTYSHRDRWVALIHWQRCTSTTTAFDSIVADWGQHEWMSRQIKQRRR